MAQGGIVFGRTEKNFKIIMHSVYHNGFEMFFFYYVCLLLILASLHFSCAAVTFNNYVKEFLLRYSI